MDNSLADLLVLIMCKMEMRQDGSSNVSEEAVRQFQEAWRRACADVGVCVAPMKGQPRELLSRRVLSAPDPKRGNGWDSVRADLRYLIRFYGSAQEARPAVQFQLDAALRRYLGSQIEAIKLHVAYQNDPAPNKQRLYESFRKLGLPPLVSFKRPRDSSSSSDEDEDASPPQKRQRTY
jgi:hypothetical protein